MKFYPVSIHLKYIENQSYIYLRSRQIFFQRWLPPRRKKRLEHLCMLYVHTFLVCLSVFNNYMSKRLNRFGLHFLRQLILPQERFMEGKICKMLKTVNSCSVFTVNSCSFQVPALILTRARCTDCIMENGMVRQINHLILVKCMFISNNFLFYMWPIKK